MNANRLTFLPAYLILATLAAAPALSQDGDPSKGAPPDDRPPRGGRERGPGGMGDRGPGRPGGPFDPRHRNAELPTDQEWAEISAFMKENLPYRWTAYEEKESDPATAMRPGRQFRLTELKRNIASRYRMYKRLETDAPALYAAVLTQAQAEDKVWGAWREFNKDRESETLKAKLKEKVTELVNANLAERQQRVEQLRAALAREEKNLAGDREKTQAMVDAQYERWTGDEFPGTGGGMGGGGFGGPGGGPPPEGNPPPEPK